MAWSALTAMKRGKLPSGLVRSFPANKLSHLCLRTPPNPQQSSPHSRQISMTKVLVLDPHAEIYRDRLQAEFPALQFVLAHNAGELPADLSDIDVLISFGIELKDEFYQRAAGLKWVQCLATGVDHLLRCPSLKPDSPSHQRPRHSRRADARDDRLSDDGRRPRGEASGGRAEGARLGPALLESFHRQDRGDRRRRRDRHRHRQAAQGVRDARHRRHAHAARRRRLRRDDADGAAHRKPPAAPISSSTFCRRPRTIYCCSIARCSPP